MTHRDHIRLGFEAICAFGFAEASDRVYEKIEHLARSQGTARKFNATLTLVWMRAIAAHMHDPAESFEQFIERESVLLDKDLPLRFYSRERLFSERARLRFAEPDRHDLPRIAIQP